MIYLPKAARAVFSRFAAAYSKSCLRGKENSKHFAQLKKIMLCEALVSKNDKSPVDIPEILRFTARRRGYNSTAKRQAAVGAFIRRRGLSYKQADFTALLLTLADNCGENGNIFIFQREAVLL